MCLFGLCVLSGIHAVSAWKSAYRKARMEMYIGWVEVQIHWMGRSVDSELTTAAPTKRDVAATWLLKSGAGVGFNNSRACARGVGKSHLAFLRWHRGARSSSLFPIPKAHFLRAFGVLPFRSTNEGRSLRVLLTVLSYRPVVPSLLSWCL